MAVRGAVVRLPCFFALFRKDCTALEDKSQNRNEDRKIARQKTGMENRR